MSDLSRRAVLLGIGAAIAPLAASAAAGADIDIKPASSFNVRDYGAAGDGMTDDTQAVVTALSALPDSGGTVFFPAGTYNISSADGIRCTKSGVRFVGDGKGAVIKCTPSRDTSSGLLDISSAVNIVIENLTFDGNAASVAPKIPTMVKLSDVSNITIRNCSFLNISGTGINAFDASLIWITGNYFENCGFSGIYFGRPTVIGAYNENIWITDNYLKNCQTAGIMGHGAIQVRASGLHRNLHVLNNTVINPGKVGLGLDNIYQSNVVGNTIIKEYRENTLGECIAFGGSENVIAENFCRNNSVSYAACILLYAPRAEQIPCYRNQIINNRCTNGAQGIGFVWAEQDAEIGHLLIQGNICYDNGFGVHSFLNTGVTKGSQFDIAVSNNILTGNKTPLSLADEAGGVSGAPAIVTGNQPDNTDSIGASDVVTTKVPVPASASSAGIPGQWAIDSSGLYICMAANTWLRADLASW